MKPTTLGDLIEGEVRTTRHCQWCNDFADVDLRKIALAKGASFSLVDRLPICTNGDCLGMVRFQVHRGIRREWLMTAAGDARFQAHSDWMFSYRQVLLRKKRQQAAQTTKGPPSEESGPPGQPSSGGQAITPICQRCRQLLNCGSPS